MGFSRNDTGFAILNSDENDISAMRDDYPDLGPYPHCGMWGIRFIHQMYPAKLNIGDKVDAEIGDLVAIDAMTDSSAYPDDYNKQWSSWISELMNTPDATVSTSTTTPTMHLYPTFAP